MTDENKTERLHMLISPSELKAIDDWGFKNRIRTKAEAVRRLCQIGLAYERDGKVLLKRSERALKATLIALDRVSKADIEKMPRIVRPGLVVALGEQSEALKAAFAVLIAAGVYSNGLDPSEMDDLIKRAEGYIKALVPDGRTTQRKGASK